MDNLNLELDLGDKVIRYIAFINNIASAIGALMLNLTVLSTCALNFKASNRLSYRIYYWVSLSDLLYNIPLILKYIYLGISVTTDQENMFFMRHYIFGAIQRSFERIINLWFVYLTTCLAYNLHTVFLRRKFLVTSSHWKYAGFTFIIPFFCILPSFVVCFEDKSFVGLESFKYAPWNSIYFFSVFGGPIFLCCLYCSYVFIMTLIKLNRFNKEKFSQLPSQNQFHFNLLAKRLIGYAIIPIITQFPYVCVFLNSHMGNDGSLFTTFLVEVLGSCNGWLNLLCFIFDPSLPNIWKEYLERKASGTLFNAERDPKSIIGQFRASLSPFQYRETNNRVLNNCSFINSSSTYSQDSSYANTVTITSSYISSKSDFVEGSYTTMIDYDKSDPLLKQM